MFFLEKEYSSTPESKNPPTQKTNEFWPLILFLCGIRGDVRQKTPQANIETLKFNDMKFVWKQWLSSHGPLEIPRPNNFHIFFLVCQVALQDSALISVFDALEISVEDAWNLFRTLDSDPWMHEMAETNKIPRGTKTRKW